jgi:hypothetical protein
MANVFRKIGNGSLMLALRLGLPAPPYTRRNAVILETVGRTSGRVRQASFVRRLGTDLRAVEITPS